MRYEQYSVEELKQIFYLKTELILNGLELTNEFFESIDKVGLKFYGGRKGGAGPAGGRYFLFENGSVANVPLWNVGSNKSYLVLKKIITGPSEDVADVQESYYNVLIVNKKTGQQFDSLKLVPIFHKYNNTPNLSGHINKKVALIHGVDCLASTIYQTCKYWRTGEQCKFCGIELSLKSGDTIASKSAAQLIKAIETARKMNLCSHTTFTSGTLSTKDKGIREYIRIVKEIKSKFPDLPIHIQFEPFEEINLYYELKDSGVDTVGIHMEIINDDLRKKYCPGKSKIPKSVFEKHWKKAVEVFGRGQVSSFILLSGEQDIGEIKKYLDKIIAWGVIPFIVPMRYIQHTLLENEKDFKPISLEDNIDILEYAAKSLIRHDLSPLDNKSGCVRCGGCSPITDAFLYLKKLTNSL
ncbi:MAG: radical SAM protein [Promethearchaeota archaeon]